MPDNPATPGPDPMCMDQSALEWAMAWVGHQTPPVGKAGFMYMLAGGTDASNTDPYASKPEPGNHWIKTGPHVMVVGADSIFFRPEPEKRRSRYVAAQCHVGRHTVSAPDGDREMRTERVRPFSGLTRISAGTRCAG
jgi:hypothetical protein